MLHSAVLGLCLGLAANGLADIFLARDSLLRRPYSALTSHQRLVRFVRWFVSTLALVICAWLNVAVDRLVAIALMTVTASTDFDCRLLPPAWYIDLSVVTSVLLAGLSRGLDAGIDAAIAQGLCFSIGVFIALWNPRHAVAGMDPGDIRTLMQMGATAGSFPGILLTVMGIAIVGLLITLIGFLMRRRVHAVPLATLAWCGLVLMPITLAVLQDGFLNPFL
jgi:hypothetical protein